MREDPLVALTQRGTPTAEGTRTQILAVALRRFAADGFVGTSLNDIADEVGIKRPSLLYHFPSKEELYRATVLSAVSGWIEPLRDATTAVAEGWEQIERVLRAAFRFFEEQPALVRLARREAIDGGPMFTDELAAAVRPLLDRATRWLEAEMDAGRLRRYDATQLVITSYGAVLSYFSDATLVTTILGADPLAPSALEVRREHVLDVLRAAYVG